MEPKTILDRSTRRALSVDKSPVRLSLVPPGFTIKEWAAIRCTDESQWVEFDRTAGLKIQASDVGKRPDCIGHSFAKAMEIAAANAGSYTGEFSTSFIRLRIGYPDHTIDFGAAADLVKTVGIPLREQVPDDATSVTDTNLIKPDDVFICRGCPEVCSDIINWGPVVMAVKVGSNIADVPANGVVPPPIQTAGTTTFVGVGLVRINNEYHVKALNNWGSQWSKGGFCFFSMNYLRQHLVEAYTVVVDKTKYPVIEPSVTAVEDAQLNISFEPVITPKLEMEAVEETVSTPVDLFDDDASLSTLFVEHSPAAAPDVEVSVPESKPVREPEEKRKPGSRRKKG